MKLPIVVRNLFLFLLIIAGTGLFIFFPNDSEQPTVPVPVPKQVKYGFTLKNKTNTIINNGMLWIDAPLQTSTYQTCENLEAGQPFQLEKDANDGQILAFPIRDLPPFATRLIHINAKISYVEKPRKTVFKDRKAYLLPEPYVESTHPEIVLLAEELKATTPLKTAQNIFNWVSSEIKYSGYIKNSRGALHTLKKKQGDCTEYMYLFIALCRANQIPARGIGGYTCSENCIIGPDDYHNWAEFYVDGSWQLADCQKKVFVQKHSDYIAMHVISNEKTSAMKGYQRFRFQGTGVSVKMNH